MWCVIILCRFSLIASWFCDVGGMIFVVRIVLLLLIL